MSIDIDKFDFGFTAVDESELKAVQETTAKLETSDSESAQLEEKLNKLYNAILPLLSNLKMNPEKEYILWPNRVEKVEEFEELISNIVK